VFGCYNPSMAEAAQPENKRSLVGWALALLGAGILILGLGTFLVWRMIAPQVDVIRTAGGGEGKAPASPEKTAPEGDGTGLPKYPGAEATEPPSTVEIDSATEEDLAVTVAKYSSKDALEKVDDWYKEHLGPEFEREGSGMMDRKRAIYGTDVAKEDVAFLLDREHALQAVILRRKGAAIEIVLVHAAEADE